MKWIGLKLKNLPIISLEIDRALQVFETLMSKYNMFRKRQQLQQITQLQISFTHRIAELDSFYKDHHLDDNISIFHMLKVKLQRAIFRANQLNAQITNEISFKEDSLNLFPENQIKILEQPLFTYYQTSKRGKDDYFDFAKDAPKEEISSFGGIKNEKKGPNQIKAEKNQSKNQFTLSHNKPKDIVSPIASNKKNLPNKATNLINKKSDKKTSLSYKTANFPTNPLIKQQQKVKAKQKQKSPQQKLLQSNLLQCLNSQTQLKFTIKMTKDEYRSLLEMKKKLIEEQKH